MVSDQSPPFTNAEFKEFLRDNGSVSLCHYLPYTAYTLIVQVFWTEDGHPNINSFSLQQEI